MKEFTADKAITITESRKHAMVASCSSHQSPDDTGRQLQRICRFLREISASMPPKRRSI